MIALLQAYKSNRFTIKNIKQNIASGISIGIIALPLSMAFAIASGATPASGIYTAIISAIIVAIFGGTQFQISGPTGAFVVILSSITAQHGFIGLQGATILAGMLLCIMGLFHLGSIVNFIPYTVIVGFTTGIGIVIFIGQWKSFFGLSAILSTHDHFYEKIVHLLQALPTLHIKTTLLACLSLAVYILSKQYIKKIPASLITLLCATTIHIMLQDCSIATIGSVFGAIPQQLPTIQLPDFSTVSWILLIQPACTIALLGAIESLLSAVAIDAITQQKHNSNQELIGQGLANIITPFFGGFASTGAIARTITNVRNGGNCPVSALTHSATLICIILLFAPYASYIPLCSLAAILFIISYNMSDFEQFVHITYLAPWYDVIVLITTCILTIMIDLVVAVACGCVLAFSFFLIRLYQTRHTCKKTLCLGSFWKKSITQVTIANQDNKTVHVTIQGPFFFGVAKRIESDLLSAAHTNPIAIIVNFQNVPFIDITGLTVFYIIVKQYHQRGIKIYLEQTPHAILQKMKKVNIDHFITKG